ncbi:MAG TPA: cupin domain-containing protein [Anaerolineae bacterium]|nr:cupin domain-containing protein [Anaerolineae bacterium]HNT04913.1 cupin domain-containing protein [Anaerolineae bacterium]
MKVIDIAKNRTWSPGGHSDCLCQDVVSAAVGATLMEIHTTTLGPGGRAELHSHSESEEVFIILSGELVFFDETGAEYTARAGQAVFVPINGRHGTVNRSDKDVKLIAIQVPPNR